jgi:hypothetical protein
MNTDIPETDAMVSADQHHLEDDIVIRMRTLERDLADMTEQRDGVLRCLQDIALKLIKPNEL